MSAGHEDWFIGDADNRMFKQCDFIVGDECCDAVVAYEIRWKYVASRDLDTVPLSWACLEHGVLIDRNQIEQIKSMREDVLS